MLIFLWWPARIVFVLFFIAALALGGSAYEYDIPFLPVLLYGAIACWLIALITSFIHGYVAGYRIDVSARWSNARRDGMEALLFLYPGLIILCAPMFFILTGSFWLPVVTAGVAAYISIRVGFPIL